MKWKSQGLFPLRVGLWALALLAVILSLSTLSPLERSVPPAIPVGEPDVPLAASGETAASQPQQQPQPVVSEATILQQAKTTIAAAKAQKAPFAEMRVVGASGFSEGLVKQIAAEAGTLPMFIHADAMVENTVYLDVRITLQVGAAQTGWNVAASTRSQRAATIQQIFGAYFKNQVQAICFSQGNQFQQPVYVTVPLLFTPADPNGLAIYQYSMTENRYTKLDIKYQLSEHGFLSFYSNCAGDLVVSDGLLP